VQGRKWNCGETPLRLGGEGITGEKRKKRRHGGPGDLGLGPVIVEFATRKEDLDEQIRGGSG